MRSLQLSFERPSPAYLLICVLLVCWAARPCTAGSASGEDDSSGRVHETGQHVTLSLRTNADVEVFEPAGYNGSTPTPLLVFLHGFCLPDSGQQDYSFTALRASPDGRQLPRRQTLTQVGMRELIDKENFLYATPVAPHFTRQCALCNVANQSPNVADRLTTQWINSTLSRVAPMFYCPAWDGSDACCNPELAGRGDDAQWLLQVIEQLSSRYNVDSDRVYAFGIATGGFMANRLACEAPGVFAAVTSFAGSTWSDPGKCAPPAGETTNMLNIHGTADLTVPIDGGANFAGVPFPAADDVVDMFADKFGCMSDESNEPKTGEFALPAETTERPGGVVGSVLTGVGIGGNDTVEVATRTFEGCRGGATVEQWRLAGVDHFMEEPTSRAMFATAVEWMMAKTRPSSPNA